jgi:hypothetical protein
MTFEQHLEGVLRLADDATVPERWYEAPAFYFTNPYAVLGPQDDVPVPPGCRLGEHEALDEHLRRVRPGPSLRAGDEPIDEGVRRHQGDRVE